MKEAGDRSLEREPEVGSGNLAVISAVDSIAESDDLSIPLLESRNSRGKKGLSDSVVRCEAERGCTATSSIVCLSRLSVSYICVGPVC